MTDPVLPAQHDDAKWLAETGTRYLAHEMRVGKTASAIRACDLLGAMRILWLTTGAARLSHARAWAEYGLYDHDAHILLSGKDVVTARDGIYITSYDLAAGALYKKLMRTQFDAIILDEAHKLANRKTKRTVAVFGEDCDRADGLTSIAEHVIPLSGTPAPNHPGEMWAVLRALFPDSISYDKGRGPEPMSYWKFESKFCKTKFNHFGGVTIVGAKNVKDLGQRIRPYFRRRLFKDTYKDASGIALELLLVDAQSNLDELIELERSEWMTEFKQRLDAVSEQNRPLLMKEIDEKIAMRIRRLTGLAKVPGVVAWAKELLADGRKVVLFGHHKEVLDGLCDGLSKFKPIRVSGGVSPKAKSEAAELFRKDPQRKVFVGNLLAAGEAIDLSTADDVGMVEASWVPGENKQAVMRVVNMSKRRENIAWFATLRGSIDERIQETNRRKTKDLIDLF